MWGRVSSPVEAATVFVAEAHSLPYSLLPPTASPAFPRNRNTTQTQTPARIATNTQPQCCFNTPPKSSTISGPNHSTSADSSRNRTNLPRKIATRKSRNRISNTAAPSTKILNGSGVRTSDESSGSAPPKFACAALSPRPDIQRCTAECCPAPTPATPWPRKAEAVRGPDTHRLRPKNPRACPIARCRQTQSQTRPRSRTASSAPESTPYSAPICVQYSSKETASVT